MPSVTSRRNWLRRLGWLVLIWAASVFALAIVAMVFRLLLSMAGMTA
ncbi:DUF2474 domain-containing protein [Rhizobium mayense]|uniref:DUF2474 domain-containing protein n=1 Tax=Rhizobium mayense TaxID=1312184 RepID=A0ABT7K1H7_9HYPH|nr:DUF2474 domain-containing protein [Rhizobium mayense]MDL2402462.1 DUF2474 domain-containing protein [Rhizobium mayense]